MDSEERPAKTLVAWFSTQVTGCVFASSFASKGIDGRIVFSTIPSPGSEELLDIDAQLEACGRESRAACLVFPSVNTLEQLGELLSLLDRSRRWRVREHSRDARGVLIIVEWRTETEEWSRSMGLAPMMNMPTTRRAPHVALALWPGPAKKKKKSWVGFIDMPSEMRAPAHEKALEQSVATVSEILDDDGGEHWRDVAFRIPTTTWDLVRG